MKTIKGIGFESSCDETSVSIVENGKKIIANPIYSQIDLHKKYGGVVPEVASRSHLEKMPVLLDEMISQIDFPLSEINYISVTVKPGLVGSLLIGYYSALALAEHIQVPVIPIHHLEAHIYAVQLEHDLPEYPFIGLLLSGGNSALYHMKGLGKIDIIGDTSDDACGEALDKAASLLDLPYPGGPYIEKEAKKFLESHNLSLQDSTEKLDKKNPLPYILKEQGKHSFNFSFSGIKTALLYLIQKNKNLYTKEELAYYFQSRLIEVIDRNTKNAVNHFNIRNVISAGGVTANSMLRKQLEKTARENNFTIKFPSLALCTDNAAMVASLGYNYYIKGVYPKADIVTSKNFFDT